MGNRFAKHGISSDVVENNSISAKEAPPCTEKQATCTKMTTRLAIRGLNWSYTSVFEVFQVFTSMLQDPTELVCIKVYRLNTSKLPKPELFGVAEFRSAEAAKTAFEKINRVELSERSGVFVLEVVPDAMAFVDPVEECSGSNVEQPEPKSRGKSEKKSSSPL